MEGEGIGSFRGNVFGQRGLADGTAMTTAPVDVSGRKIQDQVPFQRLFFFFLVLLRSGHALSLRYGASPAVFDERRRCLLPAWACRGGTKWRTTHVLPREI